MSVGETPSEPQHSPLHIAVAAFRLGERAGSAMLPLSDLTVVDAHSALIKAGFWGTTERLVAGRTREGRPQWRRRDGGATADEADPSIVPVRLYAHVDGAVVRIYPFGDPLGRRAPAGIPSATKSVVFRLPVLKDGQFIADTSPENEAFRLTDGGDFFPRSARPADGFNYDASRPQWSWQIAVRAFTEAGVIRLARA